MPLKRPVIVEGPDGAGKSTLIRLINLLERPTGGRVLIDNVDLTELSSDQLRKSRQKIGMIFQHFNLLMSKTVAQNVAFPLQVAGDMSKEQIAQRVESDHGCCHLRTLSS